MISVTTPPSPVTWGLAAVLGTAGHALLVKLARLDETGWQVFVRHLRYQAHYPALSPHDAPPPQIPPAVPRRVRAYVPGTFSARAAT